MKREKNRSRVWKIGVSLLLLIIFLSGARFVWMHTFADEEKAQIIDGELDLRQENRAQESILALDGLWEFYPSTFIMEEKGTDVELIQVPGDWSDYLHHEQEIDESYGYGSYRLRILVDPDDDSSYSIRVPSVRSASELYVNGRKLENSGTVGKSEDTYTAENIPYTTYFTAEDGVIDIVVQVANFRDPRSSGLIRSLKFSTQKNLSKHTNLSIGLQQIMLVILLIHSLYAMILYVLGNRNKRLIYFALFVLSATIMFGLGLEEKFLHVWLGIDYTFAFRLSTLTLIAIGYFLFKVFQNLLSPLWRKILIVYEVACLISAICVMTLPVDVFLKAQEVNYILSAFSFNVAIYLIFRVSLRELKQNFLLLFAVIAFFHNAVWTFALMFNGIKIMYYPFDLIISVICLAAFWFQQYFEMHKETERISLKLQEADLLKDEFLASTSHELKNPLHAIINISHAVLEREKGHLENGSIKDLETVLSVGRRMSTVVNDLLDVMALKETTPRLTKSTFHLQSVTNGVIDMLEYLIEGKNVQLINELPSDLPAVYADENRIIQVLFNLVHNGIKYTHEGTVSVSGYVKGAQVYVVVKDTGIGIDEEILPSIFDSYEQGSIVSEGGFGLGLSISKQLIELHGGNLEVTSKKGQGSTFTFSLQQSHEEGALEASAIEQKEMVIHSNEEVELVEDFNKTSPVYSQRPCVLIVDDDVVNLQVVRRILSPEMYDITTVMSGEEALDKLHVKHWDLVIADVMMPQMSGYALTREIRKRFTITELPILLLTARTQVESIEQGFISGANDYVAKPVEPLELRSRVHALTSVRKSMHEHVRMEAAWLQAQIQPHFLFNALNTIMALSELDPARMKHVLDAFSEFLRGKFNFQNVDDLIPIQDEIDLIETYLYIEKERFGDRLQIEWELDDVGDVSIPPLTIQPLVENAILHGLMKQIEGGTICIQVRKHESFVSVAVKDNGIGMSKEVRERLLQRNEDGRTGVGLLNTHIRLKRQFNSGLQIDSAPGKGTTISFVIPRLIHDKDLYHHFDK